MVVECGYGPDGCPNPAAEHRWPAGVAGGAPSRNLRGAAMKAALLALALRLWCATPSRWFRRAAR